MSHVTDVILTISLAEVDWKDDRCHVVETINAWLSESDYGELKRVDDFTGGRKAIQAAIFMGAFNYLNILEFVAKVDAAPWEYREGLALFVKDEHDARFSDMTPNHE
jgi:hypothetical protein